MNDDRSDSGRLIGIILAAFVTRVASLWVGRDEFLGWFNHSYYYFVQVRGLVEEGRLPYPDMPLLFLLDAGVAEILLAMGVEPDTAIVASTRLVMCLVPALIPVAMYGIIRNLNGPEGVQRNQWVLILVSGFLPLSISHLPQSMQKNLLGIFLLSVLILASHRLLRKPGAGSLLTTVGLFLLIVFSHFGTFGASVFYGAAVLVAYVMVHRNLGKTLVPALALTLSCACSIAAIYLLDAQRFYRLLSYARDSIGNSLLGRLLAGDVGRSGLFGSVAVVLGIYAVLYAGFRIYARSSSGLSATNRVIWLANILFCALLVLPVLDEKVMGRFVVFLALPALIVLAYMEKYGFRRSWLRTAVVVATAGGVLLLAVGEVASTRFRSAGNVGVFAELRDLQARHPLTADDLVITKTGGEHICNWFYRVKAGVITSLDLDDFQRYDRIYVLNPIEGELDLVVEDRTATSEADRYVFMLKNIPRPAHVEPLFLTEHIEFFELESPPENWEFTSGGRFHGYSK